MGLALKKQPLGIILGGFRLFLVVAISLQIPADALSAQFRLRTNNSALRTSYSLVNAPDMRLWGTPILNAFAAIQRLPASKLDSDLRPIADFDVVRNPEQTQILAAELLRMYQDQAVDSGVEQAVLSHKFSQSVASDPQAAIVSAIRKVRSRHSKEFELLITALESGRNEKGRRLNGSQTWRYANRLEKAIRHVGVFVEPSLILRAAQAVLNAHTQSSINYNEVRRKHMFESVLRASQYRAVGNYNNGGLASSLSAGSIDSVLVSNISRSLETASNIDAAMPMANRLRRMSASVRKAERAVEVLNLRISDLTAESFPNRPLPAALQALEASETAFSQKIKSAKKEIVRLGNGIGVNLDQNLFAWLARANPIFHVRGLIDLVLTGQGSPRFMRVVLTGGLSFVATAATSVLLGAELWKAAAILLPALLTSFFVYSEIENFHARQLVNVTNGADDGDSFDEPRVFWESLSRFPTMATWILIGLVYLGQYWGPVAWASWVAGALALAIGVILSMVAFRPHRLKAQTTPI